MRCSRQLRPVGALGGLRGEARQKDRRGNEWCQGGGCVKYILSRGAHSGDERTLGMVLFMRAQAATILPSDRVLCSVAPLLS